MIHTQDNNNKIYSSRDYDVFDLIINLDYMFVFFIAILDCLP